MAGTTINGSFSPFTFAWTIHLLSPRNTLNLSMTRRTSAAQAGSAGSLLSYCNSEWPNIPYSQNWPLELRAGTIPWPKTESQKQIRVARHHQGNSFQIITPVLFTKWNKPLTFDSKTKTAWWDCIRLPLFILPCRNYLRVLFKHDLQEHPLQIICGVPLSPPRVQQAAPRSDQSIKGFLVLSRCAESKPAFESKYTMWYFQFGN